MYLYENSIVDDLNRLFTNSKVKTIIADSINDGLKKIAAKEEDKITLPAIVMSGGDWEINDVNFYGLMHGSEVRREVIDNKKVAVKNMNKIPITPTYNMFIIAQSSRECDMLTREIIFHYFMNPTLTIDIPYGINNLHTFNLLFNSTVRKTQNVSGYIYRTLTFILQGAYLWHNNTYNLIHEVDTEIHIKEEVPDEI